VHASTKTAERPAQTPTRWQIGLMSERRELTILLEERPELLVIESDPLSGTSALLAIVLGDLDRPVVVVDAKTAGNALDLAMAIATAAVTQLVPRAAGWWNGASVADSEGLRLSRRMSLRGIDLEQLRIGAGAGGEQLRHALELVSELCDGPGLLAIDHVDDLLERLSRSTRLALLGILRAEHQRAGSVQQLLVGRVGGQLSSALHNREHPLYRAGSIAQVRRPKPHRFVDDLAGGSPSPKAPIAVVGAAAELADGAPAYVWRTVDAAREQDGEPRDRTLTAWRDLRESTEPSVAQQFRLLGSVHRAAPTIVCAIARGMGPYELQLNPKTINDGLTRMRARGQVFSPEKQRWAVSDPLLGAWARDRAPIAVRRRARR
jgi:hypothetical protein